MKRIGGNSYITKEEQEIYLDKVSLKDLTKQYSTPIMIFLENRLRENLKVFQDVFESVFKTFQGFYSFKANFLPEICEIISSEGIGAEVIGLPELKLALKIGVPPERILVGGPYMPEELILFSMKNKVREIIVYNINDLNKINAIAEKLGVKQKICIRIISKRYGAKLGITLDNENLIKIENAIKKSKNIEISTILAHYGTQMNNSKQFEKNIDIIESNLLKLHSIGLHIENINLGGGFPEASVMPKKQLKKIALNIRDSLKYRGINYKQIYFEPGRYFVGDTGLFVTNIVKVTKDRWIFLNIGNHICPKFARSSLRFYNTSKIENPHKYKTSIAGIIPSDQDVLAKDYFFTDDLDEGDVVLVVNVGAYNLTFSNRFPYSLPNIILVKDNVFKLIFDNQIDHDFSLN
ncbi:MAG: diaminopimelate decarboxylase family protein [Promethearchaeota archaeon]